VKEALAHNYDLQIAVAQLDEAERVALQQRLERVNLLLEPGGEY
jgi:hypothetical protein